MTNPRMSDNWHKLLPIADRGPLDWTTPRCAEAWLLREAGRTYRQIGEHFGFTQERARQVVLRAVADFQGRDDYLRRVALSGCPTG